MVVNKIKKTISNSVNFQINVTKIQFYFYELIFNGLRTCLKFIQNFFLAVISTERRNLLLFAGHFFCF